MKNAQGQRKYFSIWCKIKTLLPARQSFLVLRIGSCGETDIPHSGHKRNNFLSSFWIFKKLSMRQRFHVLLIFAKGPGLTSQWHSALISSDSEMFQFWFKAVDLSKISEQRCFNSDFSKTALIQRWFLTDAEWYFFS